MNVIYLLGPKSPAKATEAVLKLAAMLADDNGTAVICRRKSPQHKRLAKEGHAPGFLRLGGILDLLSPLVLARVLNRLEGEIVLHAFSRDDAQTCVRAKSLSSSAKRIKITISANTSDKWGQLLRQIDSITPVPDANDYISLQSILHNYED